MVLLDLDFVFVLGFRLLVLMRTKPSLCGGLHRLLGGAVVFGGLRVVFSVMILLANF